ncbi:hypothetical protein AAG570_013240 [Ranatra chinensis]|uniref:Uncharacterized protein n=1 Tax=Ranatra chinensis TaxID=642074 RepID=A0ABD0YSN0_9HEMI
MSASEVRSAWQHATQHLDRPAADIWWHNLYHNYSRPERVYHNLTHLLDKYLLYRTVEAHITNKTAVCLALFFDYLEYDPKSMENSEKNIERFKTFSSETGINTDSELYVDVIALLRCSGTHITEEHKAKDMYGTEDKHYFLDLDVAILGTEPDQYAEYAEKVKQEYHFLPPHLYNSLRLKVLQNFLQIPNIFATKVFRDKFEKQARLNIEIEIHSLQ